MGIAHLPSLLKLEANSRLRAYYPEDSWRALIVMDPEADSVTLRSMVQFAGWKAAGSDSIDVLLPTYCCKPFRWACVCVLRMREPSFTHGPE
jgi:hypothetical protein